ncbi:MAG: sugar transferase [Pseudomonadota bacterium]
MTVHFKAALKGDIPSELSADRPGETPARDATFYTRIGKRALDLVIVIAVLPIALALIAVSAIATARDGHNPFYWQKRLGRGGRAFWLLKIRTMVPDADARLETYLTQNPDARREWDYKQKLNNDPRITRLGHILRVSSIDELPQIWNVARGDMSIVGPRPMTVAQRPLYPGQAYFTLRPGITGNWQVSDRNDTGFADRAAYDERYAAAVSLATDFNILVRTLGVVLRCTGQ